MKGRGNSSSERKGSRRNSSRIDGKLFSSPESGLSLVEVKNIQGRCLDFSSKSPLVAIRSESVVRWYSGKLAVEYLRGGLVSSSSSFSSFWKRSSNIATNTDASGTIRQGRLRHSKLLWSPRVREGTNDHTCIRACGLHSDSRFYTATVGMHEDSGEQKEDSLSLSLFSFTHLAFLLYARSYTRI